MLIRYTVPQSAKSKTTAAKWKRFGNKGTPNARRIEKKSRSLNARWTFSTGERSNVTIDADTSFCTPASFRPCGSTPGVHTILRVFQTPIIYIAILQLWNTRRADFKPPRKIASGKCISRLLPTDWTLPDAGIMFATHEPPPPVDILVINDPR